MEKFGKVCKEYMIKEMVEYFREYPDFFLTTLSQVEVGNLDKFRKAAKKSSAVYMVVKNTLLKRAIEASEKNIDLKEISPFITGSCGVLFSKEDPAFAARSLVGFRKDNETFKIQGAFISGETVTLDTIDRLALLPPKDVLLSMVAAGIKSPISGFVGLLGNLLRSLVGVIDAISKDKSKS